MYKRLQICVLISSSLFASESATRIRVVKEKDDKELINNGTAFIYREYIITAKHLLEDDYDYILLQVGENWISCKVVKKDSKEDMVAIAFKEGTIREMNEIESGCIASIKGKKIKNLKAKIIDFVNAVSPRNKPERIIFLVW